MMQAVDKQIEKNSSISKTYWSYAIPSIFAMLVNGIYQVVDGIFVGHYLGSPGLAAINMAIPILGAMTGFGIMIGMGGGSLMSIYRGEKSKSQEQSVLASSIWLIALFGALATLLLMQFSEPLLTLQGAQQQVLQYAQDYMQVFAYGVVMSIGAAALPMLIRNDNSPTFATALIVIGALVNILLDYFLIGVWQLGLRGAAIATIISQSLVVLAALLYFFSGYTECKIKLFTVNFKSIAKTLHLGASSLFTFFYFGFIIALHNKMFISYGSTVHVAAFAIVGYAATIYYLIAEGISAGLQPPVSYYYGAKQNDKVIATLKIATRAVLIFGIATTLILNLFPEILIGLFNNQDADLTTAATTGIHLHLIAICLDGFLFLASVYYMAIGAGNKSIFVSLGNLLIQLPFLYFLPQWMGINGVWLAVPLSNILLTLIIAPMLYNDLKSLLNSNQTTISSSAVEPTSGKQQSVLSSA